MNSHWFRPAAKVSPFASTLPSYVNRPSFHELLLELISANFVPSGKATFVKAISLNSRIEPLLIERLPLATSRSAAEPKLIRIDESTS